MENWFIEEKIRGKDMPIRKEVLALGSIYHVFTKSIAGYNIFYQEIHQLRIIEAMRFYQLENPPCKFSRFIQLKNTNRQTCPEISSLLMATNKSKLVEIIAYCIMPTHLHLVLHQTKDDGVGRFMRKLLDSYTRYFNIRHNRKGPLWEARFKNVLVKTDEQLLHLTRYVHLNPVTAYLVDDPTKWFPSSYNEYLGERVTERICSYMSFLDVEPAAYRQFVKEGIEYQRQLAMAKA